MADQPQDIKHELAEGFEVFNLKKVAQSTLAFVKQPKRVVDSIYEGKGEFVKPIKYILTIGAPALLLINFFDVDTGKLVSDSLAQSVPSLNSVDPLKRYNGQIELGVMTRLVAKLTGEYNPIMYFMIAPLFAFFMKRAHPDKSLRYYYFLTAAWYMLGVYCLADLTTVILFGVGGWEVPNAVDKADSVFRFLFSVYVLFCIFPGSLGSRTFKSIAAISLGWVSTVIVIIPVFFLMMFNEFKHRPPWKPIQTMGYETTVLTDSLMTALQLPGKEGLLVTGIEPNSPAEMAGVMEGEVIVRIQGARIMNDASERIALDTISPGASVNVSIRRKGQEVHLMIPLLAYDSVFKPRPVAIGIADPYEPNSVNLAGFKNSARITEVISGSPAEIAGLMIGDRIVRIDGDTLHSNRAQRIASNRYGQKKAGDTTRFLIMRNGALRYISVIMKLRKEVYPLEN